MFLVRGLEKIIADKDIKKNSNSQLKKACESALAEINTSLKESDRVTQSSHVLPQQSDSSPESVQQLTQADKHFLPFELACQSKCTRIVIISLDCLQKLIAYGQLRGNQEEESAAPLTDDGVAATTLTSGQRSPGVGAATAATSTAAPPRRLIDRIVSVICMCFNDPHTDEGIQLQVIKALLTVVTASTCDIHEGTVLHAVRTTYNIYLVSYSLVNQTTAKAALTQMLNVIFTRMEQQAASEQEENKLKNTEDIEIKLQVALDKLHVTDSNGSLPSSTTETPEEHHGSDSSLPTAATATDATDSSFTTLSATTTTSTTTTTTGTTTTADQAATAAASSDSTTSEHETENQLDPTDSTFISGDRVNSSPNPELESTAAPTTSTPPITPPNTRASTPPPTTPHRDSTTTDHHDIEHPLASPAPTTPRHEPSPSPHHASSVNSFRSRESSVDSNAISTSNNSAFDANATQENKDDYPPADSGKVGVAKADNSAPPPTLTSSAMVFSHILQKDAFLVFRSLCKLSMKPLSEGAVDPKCHEIRSKVLSLQLILSILQNSGPVFRKNELFVNAIKQYLCVALSKNGASSERDVFELSLAIFVNLLANFKHHLKIQIEVFFKEIFLYILETPASSFQHKWMVIEAMTRICSDAQCIVDIYVNYDCDISLANIYARLIADLAKIAHGRHAVELGATAAQMGQLRVRGLECIVSVLKCMVEWSRDLYVNPHNQSNLGKEMSVPHDASLTSDSTSNSASTLNQNLAGSRTSLNSGASELASISNEAENTPMQFEHIKQQKELRETGIEMFKKKPSKGLTFLQQHEIIGTTSEDIAQFFHSEDRLDKTAIGDYMGENHIFNKEVMYAYVDQLDFADIAFVPALRKFLAGFRLPGEAQKIDRLMEKYAAHYCKCNPSNGVFATADAAYVLAYSVIMLTTDLHSAQVKHKMTEEQYIKMNRGINDSKDLPAEYLSEIYNEISDNEIKMRAGSLQPNRHIQLASSTTERERKNQYENEMEQMSLAARSLIESVRHVQCSFTSAHHLEHVKPMFRIAWTPFLAVFSIGLQDCDDKAISNACLDGIRCSIRITCIFQMKTEMNAYVQALSRFTLLTATSPINEMKTKNISCIKTLIAVAHTDGNYLRECWHEILKCISQLELAQLIGNGQQSSTKLSSDHTDGAMYLSPSSRTSRDSKSRVHLRESMDETNSQSIVVAVDRIFTCSLKLDGDAIVEFVKSLCAVSMDELASTTAPRIFSLQKIVEISYYNMGRIRLQWSRIWQVIGDHFNKVGCNPNEEIAFFAVDSLRQLSMKFLEKGELALFHFQKDFLRPFEYIMSKNRSPTIRDMVVRCIAQMVNSQTNNIKSGWKNIFSVFHCAASDQSESIVELSFQTMAHIIQNVFSDRFSTTVESFQDAVKCLSEFSCNIRYPDTSMEAIRLIRACAKYVADNPGAFSEHDNLGSPKRSGEAVWVRGWFPVLFELSCIINRSKLDVRTRALTVLFEIIKNYGNNFESSWWQDLFRVILRIFNVMKLPDDKKQEILIIDEDNAVCVDKYEWMTTTCNHALYAIIDVITQYYEVLSPILLDDLYGQLVWCIQQDNEQLAQSGINCLENFVISNGAKFDTNIWDKTMGCIEAIFVMSIPHKLLTWKGVDGVNYKSQMSQHANDSRSSVEQNKIMHNQVKLDTGFTSLQITCIVQQELVGSVDGIVFAPTTSRHEDELMLANAAQFEDKVIPSEKDYGMYKYMSGDNLLKLVNCLSTTHSFCKKFNCQHELRNKLWKAGFSGTNKPSLVKEEIDSMACIIRILFRLYGDSAKQTIWPTCESLINKFGFEMFDYYLTLTEESHVKAWTPLILLFFAKINQLQDSRFKKIISETKLSNGDSSSTTITAGDKSRPVSGRSTLYALFCDMLLQDLPAESRFALRLFYTRVAAVWNI